MNKTIKVVGCIIQKGDQILMLYRSESESDPSLWGIPAGKVEKGETDLQAAIREVKEETNIDFEPDDLTEICSLPIYYPELTVEFPMFHTKVEGILEIKLNPREHIDYKWMKPKDVLELDNLMKDVDIIIKKHCIEKLKI